MKRESYEKLNAVMQKSGLGKTARILNNAITVAVFVFYPALLILLFSAKYEDLLKMVIVPLAAFILVSILRYFLNFKRPYEEMNIEPIASKRKSGKSFPSRHTFSIFMIALCSMHLNIMLGAVLLFIGILLAVLRVLCGTHYIKDVLAGTLFAIAAYIVGFICF